jgi:hypothetical protein
METHGSVVDARLVNLTFGEMWAWHGRLARGTTNGTETAHCRHTQQLLLDAVLDSLEGISLEVTIGASIPMQSRRESEESAARAQAAPGVA